MIKTLEIKNFQSHKDTVIEFHPGVNVIQGSSRNGKSAILRALNYVINNKPSGMRHISFWAKEKTKILDPCKVSITFGEGHTVSRIRGDINGYQIDDGKPLEAIEQSVPDAVSQLCNFSEINIQKQMDAPFLLATSSGEVSKFFNRVLRLEDADEYQSLVEGKRRKCNADVKAVEEIIPSLQKELAEYSWIEEAEYILSKIVIQEAVVQGLETQNSKIRIAISDMDDLESKLERYAVIGQAEEICTQILLCLEEVKSLRVQTDALASACEKLTQYNSVCEQGLKISGAEKLIAKLEVALEYIIGLESDMEALRAAIAKECTLVVHIKMYEEDIAKLEKSLPAVCPLCGKELNKCI
jgi:exonuclease SbcC